MVHIFVNKNQILTSRFVYFRGKYPFGDYITYGNFTFTLREVKHLWKKNDCVGNYNRHLIMRVDDFEKPSETNVLCSNWRKWTQPIIWYLFFVFLNLLLLISYVLISVCLLKNQIITRAQNNS